MKWHFCPRGSNRHVQGGYRKSLFLTWGVKNCIFFVRGGSKEKMSEGGKIVEKMSEGGKVVEKNVRGG